MARAGARRNVGTFGAAARSARSRAFAPLVEVPHDLNVKALIPGYIKLGRVLKDDVKVDGDVSLAAALPDGERFFDVVLEAERQTDLAEDGKLVQGVASDALVRDLISPDLALVKVIPSDLPLTGVARSLTVGQAIDPNVRVLDVLPADARVADLLPAARVVDVLPTDGERVSGRDGPVDFRSFHIEY